MSRKFVANPRLRHTGTVADELITDAGDVTEAPSSYDTTVAHPDGEPARDAEGEVAAYCGLGRRP